MSDAARRNINRTVGDASVWKEKYVRHRQPYLPYHFVMRGVIGRKICNYVAVHAVIGASLIMAEMKFRGGFCGTMVQSGNSTYSL